MRGSSGSRIRHGGSGQCGGGRVGASTARASRGARIVRLATMPCSGAAKSRRLTVIIVIVTIAERFVIEFVPAEHGIAVTALVWLNLSRRMLHLPDTRRQSRSGTC
jgi:hypothetical protein